MLLSMAHYGPKCITSSSLNHQGANVLPALFTYSFKIYVLSPFFMLGTKNTIIKKINVLLTLL